VHVPTHILSGWVVSNAFPLRPRERLCCMIAATFPDLDGIGILFGQDAYQRWHHVACHSVPFGSMACAALAVIASRSAKRRWPIGVLFLALFHLHLVMDYFGSGPGWPIVYFWPFSNFRLVNWQAWELNSWQNTLSAAVLLAATVGIAVRLRRTPLELLMPSLDAQLVRKPSPAKSAEFLADIRSRRR